MRPSGPRGQNVVSGLSAQTGQIVQPTFQTQVAGGQLSLRFTGSWFLTLVSGFRLDALTITPTPTPTPTPAPAPSPTPPPPLTDSAGGPYTGQEGAPVTLTATAAGGTGTYTYAWDLDGSGKYATAGQSVSHAFPDAPAVDRLGGRPVRGPGGRAGHPDGDGGGRDRALRLRLGPRRQRQVRHRWPERLRCLPR